MAMQRRGLAAEIAGVMSVCVRGRIRRLITRRLGRPLRQAHAGARAEHRQVLLGRPRLSCHEENQVGGQRGNLTAGLSTGHSARDQPWLSSCCRCPNTTGRTEEEAAEGRGEREDFSDDSSDSRGGALAANGKNQSQEKTEKTAREKADDEIKVEIQSLRRENEWLNVKEKGGAREVCSCLSRLNCPPLSGDFGRNMSRKETRQCLPFSLQLVLTSVSRLLSGRLSRVLGRSLFFLVGLLREIYFFEFLPCFSCFFL